MILLGLVAPQLAGKVMTLNQCLLIVLLLAFTIISCGQQEDLPSFPPSTLITDSTNALPSSTLGVILS